MIAARSLRESPLATFEFGNGSKWICHHEPEQALWIAVIFDCVKSASRACDQVKRFQSYSKMPKTRILRKIVYNLEQDSMWMGEAGEESDYWLVACRIGMCVEAIELVRGEFVRDRNEIRGILDTMQIG